MNPADPLNPSDRARLFERHRPRLLGVAYRMLGDADDAEDIVQEGFLRWQRAEPPALQSAEAWLVTVVTRLALDRLRHAQRDRARYPGPWLPAPLGAADGLVNAPAAADRGVELASDLSVALLVLLERLAPEERAAFLLRDVFGADYAEIARVLDRTEPAARQVVHRARVRVREGRPRFAAPPDLRARLLDRFLTALADDDQDALLALFDPAATLTADGGGKVSAARRVLAGRERVVAFLRGIERKAAGRLVHRHAWLNGEPAVLSDACLPGAPPTLFCATMFAIDGSPGEEPNGARIVAVYRVLNPDKLRRLTA